MTIRAITYEYFNSSSTLKTESRIRNLQSLRMNRIKIREPSSIRILAFISHSADSLNRFSKGSTACSGVL